MKKIKTEFIEVDGVTLKIDTYDNGAVVKGAYNDTPTTPAPEPLPTINAQEEAILNTNANVEYLVALKELEV